MIKNPLMFFAVAPKGVESLLLEEIKALGCASAKVSRSGVFFQGDLETAYRACLWLRTANRVLLILTRFRAETPEALYEGVRRTSWDDHLAPDGSLAVDFNASQSQIHHTRYGALKVKDAIVDQFRERFGIRPSVDLVRPNIRLNVYLQRDEATISLDLSGESLHRRGYREEGGLAPLKENLAAAILLRAGWPDIAKGGGGLLDPMTGSGTLPIEAAWMAGDVAPGLLRDYFGFLGWKGHRPDIWEKALEEARQRRAVGLKRLPPIVGYDADVNAIRSAAAHVERAGLRKAVHVEKRELAALVPHPAMKDRAGLVILNPPYGERLGEMKELRPLYAAFGMRLKDYFNGWQAGLFTGNPDLGKEMGLRAVKKYAFYNGPIACRLLLFRVTPEWFVHGESHRNGNAPPEQTVGLDAGAAMLANRLRKNLKRLKKTFQNKRVSCFRVYDRDLPEYAVAVDIYDKWIHVQEYKAPSTVDGQKAETRLRQAMTVIREALEAPESHLFLKVRGRQKGKAQYGKQGHAGIFHEVGENDYRFLVNFTDYIDTGLFPDQRLVRGVIRDLARGRGFLNLFCYTGTATVAAAKGGARTTTSVDASTVYLDWTRRNLALNGFDMGPHALNQADVLTWLKNERGSYDLILMGPPTFSNSRRFSTMLDVQRDHVILIQAAARVLNRGGIILFSANYRKFKMDTEGLKEFSLTDLSRATLPPDFEKRAGMHHLWKITRAAD